MRYVNCPVCGCKLFEGSEGSHVVVKCVKCNKLFEATIQSERIEIILKSKTKEDDSKNVR